MNASDIATMVRYNAWANGRLLAACDGLSDEDFVRDVEPDPGWGSLRGILVHALDTEFGWRSVLQESDDDVILQESDFPNVGALKARWATEEAAWMEFVDQLDREDVDLGGGGDAAGVGTVWQTIMHVIIHGVQHRSEAAAILTGLGHSPGELDLGVFLKEKGGP